MLKQEIIRPYVQQCNCYPGRQCNRRNYNRTWSGGTGTFTDPNVLNTTYTPSAADKTAGTVTLTLTSTNNGLC